MPDPPRPQRGLRPGDGLRLDRQPLEGRRLAGDPEPQPDAGAARGGGHLLMRAATQTFFRSRWANPPDGVEQLDPAELAPGFRAAAVACGLKAGGGTDVGVLACDAPGVVSALALTRNA